MGLCTRGIEAKPHGSQAWPRGFPFLDSDWIILIQLSITERNSTFQHFETFCSFMLLLVESAHGVIDGESGGLRFTLPQIVGGNRRALGCLRYEFGHVATSRQVLRIFHKRDNEGRFGDRTWYDPVAMCKYSVGAKAVACFEIVSAITTFLLRHFVCSFFLQSSSSLYYC